MFVVKELIAAETGIYAVIRFENINQNGVVLKSYTCLYIYG